MMKTQQKNYCIILAGGAGRRLWPVSQKQLPKQFLDFFGAGQTLLQQTFERFAHIIPLQNIFVSTFEDYVPIVKEQLPQLPPENILPEPVQLNTAPAAIWGTWHAVLANADANVVVTPTDQMIQNHKRFEELMLEGLDYVDTHDEFLAIGVRPTMPNTAYGYIQMGEKVDKSGFYRVQSFSEKPAINFAQLFLDSKEFLWNTGIFMWKGQTMSRRLDQLANRPSQPVETVARQMLTIAEEMEYVRASFTDRVPRQIDLFVLERCENLAVLECDFGWADIGCWRELHEVAPKDVDGNAVSGDAHVMFRGSQNCMIRLSQGMKAVIAGLDGYIVAQEGDTLLICPNSDPNYVRRIINEGQVNLLPENLILE